MQPKLPAVALTTPAWRMALVVCYDPVYPGQEDEPLPDPSWDWFPVVAVKSERWPRPGDDGWLERDELVVLIRDEGVLTTVREYTRDYPTAGRSREVVVCTWPPEEDEARFLATARRLAMTMTKQPSEV